MRVPAPPETEAVEPLAGEPVVAALAVAGPVAAAPAPRRRRPAKPAPEQPLVAKGHKVEYEDLIDMTAMVDIVFFLLIFFLVTSMQGLDSSIPMPTPSADQTSTGSTSAQPAEEADKSITVNIDDQDRIWVDGTEMANEQELVAKLYELRDGPGNPDELLIVGSGDATHGTAVMVHDSGNEAGMSAIRLAIQEKAE